MKGSMKAGDLVWGKEIIDENEFDYPWLIVEKAENDLHMLNLVGGDTLWIDVSTLIDLIDSGLLTFEAS